MKARPTHRRHRPCVGHESVPELGPIAIVGGRLGGACGEGALAAACGPSVSVQALTHLRLGVIAHLLVLQMFWGNGG